MTRKRTTGQKIRDARFAAGMTQTELADRCGWSQRKVSHIETDRGGVRVSDLCRIALVLRKPVSVLIG